VSRLHCGRPTTVGVLGRLVALDQEEPDGTWSADLTDDEAEVMAAAIADGGHPEFEVRVKFHHHHAAVEFARQLREEGLVVVQRWHFLIIGASDEDSANALAERIRAEAPAGTAVNSEGTQRTVSEGSGGNPFAYFGGLGG